MASFSNYAMACGWDYCGQTGTHLSHATFKTGGDITQFTPMAKFNDVPIKSIAGGYWHSALCTADTGQLYVFGYNEVRASIS